MNAAFIVNNFFMTAYTLLRRGLMDEDLFFEHFALDMNTVWNATTRVFEVDGRTTYKFKQLMLAAQDYLVREIDKAESAPKDPQGTK